MLRQTDACYCSGCSVCLCLRLPSLAPPAPDDVRHPATKLKGTMAALAARTYVNLAPSVPARAGGAVLARGLNLGAVSPPTASHDHVHGAGVGRADPSQTPRWASALSPSASRSRVNGESSFSYFHNGLPGSRSARERGGWFALGFCEVRPKPVTIAGRFGGLQQAVPAPL